MVELTKKPKDFTLENNTAKRVVKDYAPDKIEVEIGDSKSVDFKPQMKKCAGTMRLTLVLGLLKMPKLPQ